MSSYRYQAYGLGIVSSVRLPELPSLESDFAGGEIAIRNARLEEPPQSPDPANGVFWRSGDGLYLHWEGVATYCVRSGNEILVDPSPAAEERRVRLFLLGAAMGALLHQRGTPVFHASAVEIDGRAVAFLGGKGRGKSTLAAVLVARGHRLLTDDVLAVDTNAAGSPAVFPSFPQLKLWPDALAYLGEDSRQLPRISSTIDKRDRTLNQGFARRPVKLRFVYVLSKGPGPEITKVRPGDAIIALVKNAYANRFGSDVMGVDEAGTLARCAAVAAAVGTRNLVRPSDLDLLPAAADLIEGDVAACSRSRNGLA